MESDRLRRARRFSTACEELAMPLEREDRARLRDAVEDLWDLVDSIADVEAPGLHGLADVLPRTYAWANTENEVATESDAAPPTRQRGISAGPVPPDLHRWSLHDVSAAMRAKRVSPLDVTEAMLERVRALDPMLHSYVVLDHDHARTVARQMAHELEGDVWRGPLQGVPIGIKDSIPVAGVPCTANSRLLASWIPRRDAEAVRRLRHAGAVILGKHNLNEFGWSLPSDADLVPPPRNPWFPSEPAVGSTSGGAVAVAAQLCYAAIGTDGGGSVRLPAGQHLLVGIKPTHERVPRLGSGCGTVADIGVLARTALDAAIVLAALTEPLEAPDPARHARMIHERSARVTRAPHTVRLGIPRSYLDQVGMDEDISAAFDGALTTCRSLGMQVIDLPPSSLPHLAAGVAANFVVLAAEHHAAHRRTHAANAERYGASAGAYALPGGFLNAAAYLDALHVRDVLRAEVDAVWQRVDMLVMPTSPVARTSVARDPATHRRGGNAAYTSPFNLTGHPAASVPIGCTREGIPIGMQLVAGYDLDFDTLAAAAAIMAAVDLPPFPFA